MKARLSVMVIGCVQMEFHALEHLTSQIACLFNGNTGTNTESSANHFKATFRLFTYAP